MKKILLTLCCLLPVALYAQDPFDVQAGTANYNLPGSTGLDFTQNAAMHWNCIGSGHSKVFVSRNCGFVIPASASIIGIRVACDVIIHDLIDSTAYLTKNGVVVGGDGAHHQPVISASSISWGSDSALWGTTWTPADINDTGFGIRFNLKEISSANPLSWSDANPVFFIVTYRLPNSLETYTAESVRLYPNPAGDFVNVQLGHTAGSTRATITNTLGQLVKTQAISGGKGVLDMRGLPAGSYYLELSGASVQYKAKLSKD